MPAAAAWSVWVDTGGTFTDALAVGPDGTLRRAKVLSTSALRLTVRESSGREVIVDAPEGLASGATPGWTLRRLGDEHGRGWAVERWHEPSGIVRVGRGPEHLPEAGEVVELVCPDEPPVLAARLLTGTAPDAPLPALALRLATTLGTNALLERRGARVGLVVTQGFRDLLRLGDQRRPHLFARHIVKPEPLATVVAELTARRDAAGEVVVGLDEEQVREVAHELRRQGVESLAVSLLHAYRGGGDEVRVGEILAAEGWQHVALSHRVAPLQGYLTRTETTVVEAVLAPLLESYLRRVGEAVRGRLLVMTSAGGLASATAFHPRDSLLSGPAGGVVGAAAAARAAGEEQALTFDMGGTSTDVARWDGDFTYVFEQRVGAARVLAPGVAVETVAAGGGSVCWFDGHRLRVGPQSGGARPGPACYGAGGPLCLTDVNLLLGRLDPARFHIPIRTAPAARALKGVLAEVEAAGTALPEPDEALLGFLDIANERMAEAIRRISIRQGYDPGGYVLVAFGGAGGQHACAVAELLGVRRILVPPDAGLLSAVGLGSAAVERFAVRQVLAPLDEIAGALAGWLEELGREAAAAVRAEVEAGEPVAVRRRLLEMRYQGQDEPLEVEWRDDRQPAEAFAERYVDVFGYLPPQRPIEVVTARSVASTPWRDVVRLPAPLRAGEPPTASEVRLRTARGWRLAPVWDREDLPTGFTAAGPLLVLDSHSTTVVDEGWMLTVGETAALRLERAHEGGHAASPMT